MTDEKIIQLIESSVPEDVAMGISFLIKKHKIRRQSDLRYRLDQIKFNLKEELDLYVSRFNILIHRDGHYQHYDLYHCTTEPLDNEAKVIKF